MKIYKVADYSYEPYDAPSLNEELYFLERKNAMKHIKEIQEFNVKYREAELWEETTEDGKVQFGLWNGYLELTEIETEGE